jgi:hypothetical protein
MFGCAHVDAVAVLPHLNLIADLDHSGDILDGVYRGGALRGVADVPRQCRPAVQDADVDVLDVNAGLGSQALQGGS